MTTPPDPLTPVDPDTSPDTLWLQIDADNWEPLAFQMEDMACASLGQDGAFIADQNAAALTMASIKQTSAA